MTKPTGSSIVTPAVRAQTPDVTAPVTTPIANANVTNPEPVKTGSVRLRGVSVARHRCRPSLRCRLLPPY